jgi:Ca2+-binding RTX toxin-like protein
MSSVLSPDSTTPESVTPISGGGLAVFGFNDMQNVFIMEGQGNDFLEGGSLGDLFKGGGGNDLLQGLAGDDLLYGEEGDDEIRAGADSDNLIAGPGSNVVSGGTGADLFVFEFFGEAEENVIEDFSSEEGDRIYIEDQGYLDTEGLGIGDGEITVSFDADGNISVNGEEINPDDDFDLI